MARHDQFFGNRQEAGRALGDALRRFKGARPLVLALPRGGVPVGFEVARALGADLDILLVRKIGAPGQPELGVGAIVDGATPQTVINEDMVRMTGASPDYLRAAAATELAELERRRRAYRGNTPATGMAGRTVIVVDDGIATGGTVRAALKGIALNQPEHVVLAVPVAPPDVLDALADACDEIVCLHSPSPFYAVGAHYVDFRQTSDAEVIALLGTPTHAGAG